MVNLPTDVRLLVYFEWNNNDFHIWSSFHLGDLKTPSVHELNLMSLEGRERTEGDGFNHHCKEVGGTASGPTTITGILPSASAFHLASYIVGKYYVVGSVLPCTSTGRGVYPGP